jgi:excisionase family DNA binding protein
MSIMAIEGFVTVKEAAKIIGRDGSTICRYIRAGKLPAVSIGKTWLIRDEDVHKFTPPEMGNPAWGRRNS